MKINTGGQRGADICGNYFADIHNISNDINIFHGFKSTIPFPKSSKINYVCDKHDYILNLKCRTIYNIKHSDITIILLKDDIYNTKGSQFTWNQCRRARKDVILLNIYKDVEPLKIPTNAFNEAIINIAGQRNLDFDATIRFLEKLLL